MKLAMAIWILSLSFFGAFVSGRVPAHTTQEKKAFDDVTFYRNNCLGCHGSKAQKKFNPDLPEADMVDTIVNGRVMEEPPDMPAFSEKGINEERAKALITYMKSIRQ
jgi:hypothetical protein